MRRPRLAELQAYPDFQDYSPAQYASALAGAVLTAGTMSTFRTPTRKRFRSIEDAPMTTKKVEAKLTKKIMKVSHEPKVLDTTITQTAPTTNISAQLISAVVQGTSGSNRTGREIIMESFNFRGFLSTGAATSDYCRFLLVLDKECHAAQYVTADLFAAVGAGVPATAQINFDNRKRFEILVDRRFVINSLLVATAPDQVIQIRKKVNRRIRYFNASNAGTIADCVSNALTVVFMSANGNVSMTGQARFTFRDV